MTSPTLLLVTVQVVTAFVARNAVTPTALPRLIGTVHAALTGLTAPSTTAPVSAPAIERQQACAGRRHSVAGRDVGGAQ